MSPPSDANRLFLQRVEDLFRQLASSFDEIDPDEVEAERSDGVIRLLFRDGSRCILNRQSAANQVWLAEGTQAWHFDFDEASGAWVDSRGRGPLRQVLRDIVQRKLGRSIDL